MKKTRLFLAVCGVLGLTAAAMAQDGVLVPNRLAEAKVGEWASYRLPNDYTQKLTVTKRLGEGPDALVTVKIENIHGGEVVNAHEITQEAGEPMNPPRIPEQKGVTVSVRQDNAAVKGETIAATVVNVDRYLGDEDDTKVEWWVAKEIPVFGIVKRVVDGETIFEIADWGGE